MDQCALLLVSAILVTKNKTRTKTIALRSVNLPESYLAEAPPMHCVNRNLVKCNYECPKLFRHHFKYLSLQYLNECH